MSNNELCAVCGLTREYCVCEFPFLEVENGKRVQRPQGEAFSPSGKWTECDEAVWQYKTLLAELKVGESDN